MSRLQSSHSEMVVNVVSKLFWVLGTHFCEDVHGASR